VPDAGGCECTGGERAVAGLGVARDGAEEEAEERARAAVRQRPVPGHAVSLVEEARAEHVVGAAACHRLEHALELRGVVLAVSIEVDGGRVTLVSRDLQPAAERRAEAARGLMRVDARAVIAPDRGRGVARPVVHEQHVDGQAARLAWNGGEHAADGHLLVAGDHDGEAALRGVGRRRLHRLVLGRHQRPPPGGLGLGHAEQTGDGRRQLEHRARLARDGARHGALAPDHERHGSLAPVEVSVAADPTALAVVGHQDHRRAIELAALL
jgi:hypothetical protein